MSPRRTGLAVAAALAVLLLGCEDDSGPPKVEPSGSPSASQSGTPSESGSSPTTPTESSSPTVEPADGPRFRLPTVSGAFPAEWRIIDESSGAISAGELHPVRRGFIFVADVLSLGSGEFDDIVANVLKEYDDQKVKPVRKENRVVNGVEGWVLEGASDRAEMVYHWGTVIDGQDVTFFFEYIKAPKDPMKTVDSVLASVRWR